jgi:uncharacterized protein (DUF1778 family)
MDERMNSRAKPQPAEATFSARLPRSTKNVLQRAAELRGQSLSDFVLGTAYERAVATIHSREVIELSARDSEAFAAALLAPPRIPDDVVTRFVAAHERSQR